MPTTYPLSRWKIGAVAITRVIEIEGPSPGTFFFAEATPERLLQHAWLQPHFVTPDGRAIASIHAFVIESEGRAIVVDTCIGNDKPREVKAWNLRQGRFLADLAEAGFARERIDTVLCNGAIVWRDGKEGGGRKGRALNLQEMQKEERT